MKLKDSTRRYLLAFTTFCAAMSISFAMQSAEASRAADARGKTNKPPASNPKPEQSSHNSRAEPRTADLSLTGVTPTAFLPTPPAERAEPETLPKPPAIRVAAQLDGLGDLPDEEPTPSLGCPVVLVAEPAPAAMVTLTLSADCLGDERATIHHSGMMFTVVTGQDGSLELTVPALSENAVYIASFANGEGAVAQTRVSSLPYYDRAVLQWRGESGLQLHAMEYGASYGGDGHVWKGAPRDLQSVAEGRGGFITLLGNVEVPDARLAEVYTFPHQQAKRDGTIALRIEAEVIEANCESELVAQIIELHGGEKPRMRDLTLDVPECAATGDFLVLKNLLEDLTIASKK